MSITEELRRRWSVHGSTETERIMVTRKSGEGVGRVPSDIEI